MSCLGIVSFLIDKKARANVTSCCLGVIQRALDKILSCFVIVSTKPRLGVKYLSGTKSLEKSGFDMSFMPYSSKAVYICSTQNSILGVGNLEKT